MNLNVETSYSVFTYGSLMVPEVMEGVTGSSYPSLTGVALNCDRRKLRSKTYPGMLRLEGAATEGIVYQNISALAMKHLDNFEGKLYTRELIDVEVDNHGTMSCHPYLISQNYIHLITVEPWHFDEFRALHLPAFLSEFSQF